jgi:hypothetical protein
VGGERDALGADVRNDHSRNGKVRKILAWISPKSRHELRRLYQSQQDATQIILLLGCVPLGSDDWHNVLTRLRLLSIEVWHKLSHPARASYHTPARQLLIGHLFGCAINALEPRCGGVLWRPAGVIRW